jgi:hypothetical protein
MSDQDSLDRYWECEFNIMMSIRYHMKRQHFFSRFHRVVSILTIAFSTAAFASILNQVGVALYASATVVLLQSIDLFVDSRKSTELHNDLRRSYLILYKELLKHDNHMLTDKQSRNIRAKISEIEMDEPPIMRALLELSHNDVVKATNSKNENMIEVSWFKRITSQCFSWNSDFMNG